jgi:hypothetical protein
MSTKKATRTRRLKVQFYRHHPGILKQGWRWRITASNGRIVGAATEGYRDRRDCARNFELVTGFIDKRVPEWTVYR